jgi:hypothetical protein
LATKNNFKKTIFYKKKIFENSKNIQLNQDELSNLFGNISIKNLIFENKVVKQKIKTLLETRRATDISIILKKINLKPIEIKNAILKLDNNFNSDFVSALVNVTPKINEIENLNSFLSNKEILEEDKKNLTEPDKLFIELLDFYPPQLMKKETDEKEIYFRLRMESWYFIKTLYNEIILSIVPLNR